MIFNAIAEPEKKKWGNYKMILELQVKLLFVIGIKVILVLLKVEWADP